MRPIVALVVLAVGCGLSSDVSRELGARCDGLDECDERCLDGDRFPGGFCSTSCDDDDDCADGASCVEVDGGVCLFACRDPDACDFLGAGWRCVEEQERGGSEREVQVCIGPP